MLDRDSAPIVSSNTYRLTATKALLPTTTMAMRGLYRYMADAAVFADCFTGVTYPVVNNIVMEKRYLQVRKSSGDTVLFTFSAHFAVVPSMEEGIGIYKS